jgi:hypothetical protein
VALADGATIWRLRGRVFGLWASATARNIAERVKPFGVVRRTTVLRSV